MMETVKHVCEFFFCHFWHFLQLLLLIWAAAGEINIIRKSKDDDKI